MRLKRTGWLTKLVIVVLLIYLSTSFVDLQGQIQSTQNQRLEIQRQVDQQTVENQRLEEAIENSDDPAMLERVAREKGYVKEGEILYIDVAG